MKTCPRCETLKFNDEFYVNRLQSGGLSSYCIECCKKQQKEWFLNNRSRKSEIARNWRSRNPARVKTIRDSANKFYRAIKLGVIIRGTQCEWCDSKIGIEGAHFDYSKPLQVIWLCRFCHRKWDSNNPKTGKNFESQPV